MIRKIRYLSLIGFPHNDLRDNSTEVIFSPLYADSNETYNVTAQGKDVPELPSYSHVS